MRADIQALSHRGRVGPGLVANADPQNWTLEDLQPFIEQVLKCFGWERLVFGSDWPV